MFYDRFVKLCEQKEVKPTPLLKSLNVSPSISDNWKKPDTYPKGDTLKRLADYFDVSVDYLLGRTDNTASKSETDKSSYNSLYNSLDADGQKKVNDYISDLVASGLYTKNALKTPKRDVYDLSKQYPLALRHAKQYAAAHGDDSNLEEARRLFEEAIDKDDNQ